MSTPIRNAIPSFGTDGIRGKVGAVLTPSLILKLGFCCGEALSGSGPVLLGQDSRKSGAMLIAALTAGLTAAGKEVWTIGLCPTPAVSVLIKKLNASGGLMVSASHNPPEDNGIKVFGANGAKLNPEKQSLVENNLRGEATENFHLNRSIQGYGQSFHRSELLLHYEEELLQSVANKNLEGIPIVLDLCWGSATALGEKVFKELGAKVKVINGKPDGSRINVGCGSTQLDPLRGAVIEHKAEMGFAFDGDADRMLAVDGAGRVLDGDHALYLWGSSLQDQNKLPNQLLIGTVMSNLGFEKEWHARGGVLKRTPVGDQHVHAAMITSGAALGGEQSGHIISAEHGLCGDGLLTALQLATICHGKQLRLREWLDHSFKAFPQKLINVNISNGMQAGGWENSEPIKEALRLAKKELGQDGRVLLRASGTEPLLRVMVEAPEQKLVDFWATHLAETIGSHVKDG